MTTHRPTTEQVHIQTLFHTGQDLRIRAGAGTGKTTTLIQLAGILGEQDRLGLYLAFNKSISTEAQRKFPHHVTCLTSHSLAYRGLRSTRHAPLLEKMRNTNRVPISATQEKLGILTANITGYDGHARQLSAYQVTRHTMRTISEFCKTADETLGPQHIPMMPGIGDKGHLQLVDIVLPYARKGWADLTDPSRNALTFGHDHYFKLWALEHPRIGRDGSALFLDEAQDTNPVLASIIAEQDHLQRIVVGDSSQAIYRFTGATSFMTDDAIPGSIEARLTQSWRFGQAIADEANQLLTRLGDDMRLTGNPDIDSRVDRTLDAADAILTRTNGRALEHVMASQRAGSKVHLIGDHQYAIAFCTSADLLRDGKPATTDDLAAFSSWQQVVQYAEDSPDATDWKVLVKLIDAHGVPALRRALEQTADESQADLVVATAHKAKGREWSSVILDDDLTVAVENASEGNDPAALRDELMLGYVAVTRAQHHLNPRAQHNIEPEPHHARPTKPAPTIGQLIKPAPNTELPIKPAPSPDKFSASHRFLDALDRMEGLGTRDEIIASVIKSEQLPDLDAIWEQLADEVDALDDDPRITWAPFEEQWVAAGGRNPADETQRNAQLNALTELRQSLPDDVGTMSLAQSAEGTALSHISTPRLAQLWENISPELEDPNGSPHYFEVSDEHETESRTSDRIPLDAHVVPEAHAGRRDGTDTSAVIEEAVDNNDPACERHIPKFSVHNAKSAPPSECTPEQNARNAQFPHRTAKSVPKEENSSAQRDPLFPLNSETGRSDQHEEDTADLNPPVDDETNGDHRGQFTDRLSRAGAAIARHALVPVPILLIRKKWRGRSR